MTDDTTRVTLTERCRACDGLGWRCATCIDGHHRYTITIDNP